MIEWLNDWMIEWLNDWMIEWLNVWMNPAEGVAPGEPGTGPEQPGDCHRRAAPAGGLADQPGVPERILSLIGARSSAWTASACSTWAWTTSCLRSWAGAEAPPPRWPWCWVTAPAPAAPPRNGYGAAVSPQRYRNRNCSSGYRYIHYTMQRLDELIFVINFVIINH